MSRAPTALTPWLRLPGRKRKALASQRLSVQCGGTVKQEKKKKKLARDQHMEGDMLRKEVERTTLTRPHPSQR